MNTNATTTNTTSIKTNLIQGNFQGLPVVFRDDGYLNMTKAAKHFGKFLPNFIRSPETVAYVEALEQAVDSTVCPIIQARKGGLPGNSGTWCHPKLAVFFARWLDVRFAVWCDMTIDNILRGNLVVEAGRGQEEALGGRKDCLSFCIRVLQHFRGDKPRLSPRAPLSHSL